MLFATASLSLYGGLKTQRSLAFALLSFKSFPAYDELLLFTTTAKKITARWRFLLFRAFLSLQTFLDFQAFNLFTVFENHRKCLI